MDILLYFPHNGMEFRTRLKKWLEGYLLVAEIVHNSFAFTHPLMVFMPPNELLPWALVEAKSR